MITTEVRDTTKPSEQRELPAASDDTTGGLVFEGRPALCLDFDGVIHRYSEGWQGGVIYDVPMDRCQEGIAKLKSFGYKIVVLTSRDDLIAVHRWLSRHHIEVDEVTNKKPAAFMYVDDRGLRFTNWPDLLKYLPPLGGSL